jgi:hypothetical protein
LISTTIQAVVKSALQIHMKKMKPLKLSDAIETIREEFEIAQKRSENKELRFNVTSIEIELEVVIEEEESTSGGINWYVFMGSVSSKENETKKHKLKVYLEPVNSSGERIQVSGNVSERPY